MQTFPTHEALDDAGELMEPGLVERRLSIILWVHASVDVLLAAQALAQHLLDRRLLAASREELLHRLLLLSDEVAQVDIVLVKVDDAARIDCR